MRFLVAFFLAGCCDSNAVLASEPVPCETNVMRLQQVPADWPWLSATVDAAIGFWSTKGACFQKVLSAPEVTVAVVYDLPNVRAGSYSYTYPGQVKLDSSLDGNLEKSACVAAHELGHHLGLGHVVPPGSVMAPGVGCGCEWSAADEAELRSVRP